MAHVHGVKKTVSDTAKTMAVKMAASTPHPAQPRTTKAIATGIAAGAGKSTLKAVLTHPATLIGIGFALGYLTYRSLATHDED